MVTEEVAREALLSFVSSKCCYGSAAAGDLVIQELKQQTLCRVRAPRPGGHPGAAQDLGPGGVAYVMSNGRKESWGAVHMNRGDTEALFAASLVCGLLKSSNVLGIVGAHHIYISCSPQ